MIFWDAPRPTNTTKVKIYRDPYKNCNNAVDWCDLLGGGAPQTICNYNNHKCLNLPQF